MAACLLLAVCLVGGPAGCRKGVGEDASKPPASSKPPGSSKPLVGVTIPPQVWLVRQLADDLVDVVSVVGEQDDPHSFQPTDAQISRLARCRVFLRIGVPVENGPWFGVLTRSSGLRVVDVRQNVALRHMEAHGHDHDHDHAHDHGAGCSGDDPHIWLSPTLLKVQARTVAEALTSLLPAREQVINERLAAFASRIDALDRDLRLQLGPHTGETVFVFHPSWGYFLDEYGLEQVPLEQGGKEPSDSEMTSLQSRMTQAKARFILVQPQITGRSAEALARVAGIKLVRINPLASDVEKTMRELAVLISEGP